MQRPGTRQHHRRSLRAGYWNTVLLGVVFGALPVTTQALTPAELITPELEKQTVFLAGLNEGVLSYFDAERRLTTQPVSGFVRLSLNHGSTSPLPVTPPAQNLDRDPAEQAAVPEVMRVELVDGQRLVGRRVDVARDGEALVWEHATLGRFTLPLDIIRSLARLVPVVNPTQPANGPDASADRVTLKNGDTLAGFLLAVSATGVTLQPDGTTEGVELPWEGVAEVHLANPPSESMLDGDLVTLRDGSRVRATAVRVRGESLAMWPSLEGASNSVELALGEVDRIDFAASGLRLVDLLDQPRREEMPAEPFGLRWPTSVDAGLLRLHAPTVVVFDLPAGTRRLVAKAELDLPGDLTASRVGWASLELRVNGQEPAITLDERQPTVTLNTALDPTLPTLTLELDDGQYGPVLDRLRLRDAMLLVDTPQDRPGSGE